MNNECAAAHPNHSGWWCERPAFHDGNHTTYVVDPGRPFWATVYRWEKTS